MPKTGRDGELGSNGFMDMEFTLEVIEKVLGLDSDDGYITL